MAGKTIKQVADVLGVSKTAIRNYMDDDFRAKYTEKDDKGVITITPDGYKLIALQLGRAEKLTETPESDFSETAENNENIVVPRSVWNMMMEQLKEKDRQLAARDKQLADLTDAVKSQAQSINADRHNTLADTLQAMLEASDPEPSEEQKKPGLLARLFGR